MGTGHSWQCVIKIMLLNCIQTTNQLIQHLTSCITAQYSWLEAMCSTRATKSPQITHPMPNIEIQNNDL